MADIESLSNDYERKLAQQQAAAMRAVREAYESAIVEIALKASTLTIKGQTFNLGKYPLLNDLVEKVMGEMHASIYATVVNSIKDSWDLSNEKNNILVDRRLAGRKPSKAVAEILYDPNKGALDAFIKRKEKGLNLSGRVWKTLDNYKTEMEGALGVGISEGQSAQKMASQMKQWLQNPDDLFRRVRNAKGELKLSKRAQEYHPGQGVYRSSYKNALRLTRTETNIAYRSADHERWGKLDFVKGIEIKLSNNHPVYDICDEVKGQYPKDFKFSGWHPQCRCFAVPVMMTDEEYEKYENALLDGEEPPPVEGITEPPEGFQKYVDENKERIEGWKNEPYWKRDNPNYFNADSKKIDPQRAKQLAFEDSLKDLDDPLDIGDALEMQLVEKGHDVFTVSFPTLTAEQARARAIHLNRLFDEYNPQLNENFVIKATSDKSYGEVDIDINTGLPKYINTGDKIDGHRINNQATFKSRVDAENMEISTTYHEFAHVLTTDVGALRQNGIGADGASNLVEFWKGTRKVEKEYYEWLKGNWDVADYEANYLGQYAEANSNEFFAEAFTEYKLKSKPSRWAVRVGELVDKHFKKK